MLVQKVRGFPDHLPEASFQYDSLISQIQHILHLFDFQKVNPPILEHSSLFSRSLGIDSDIVNKEMYSFQQGDTFLTLRPEGTASIARMFITQKLAQQIPLKWYYHGPMFRHERPQKGRFRQFHQLGVEYIGNPNTEADIEILSMAWFLVKKLQLQNHVQLEINSIGSVQERQLYKQALKNYLLPLEKDLSPISQKRLKNNPLRILDSKEQQDQDVLKQAPVLQTYLQKDTLNKYASIKNMLQKRDIPFHENPSLVRGLDYYNDLVFEYTSPQLGKSQSSFLAGGRYDHLIQHLKGPATAAVGWALGLERLSLLTKRFVKQKISFGLVSVGDKAIQQAHYIAHDLRSQDLAVSYYFSGNISKQIKRISETCLFALIYGNKEHDKQEILIKNLKTSEQNKLSLNQLAQNLTKQLQQANI